jgi:2'-5' RNA ligase
VLAVELADGDGALAALQRDVGAMLVDAVGWAPERRPFLAHVTVARVRARPPEVGEPPEGGPFAATAVTLFRSHLGRGGSRYEALARVPLG